MHLLALVLPGCTFSLLLIACVAGTKRGGGREKTAKSPLFSLSPYPLPLSMPATQAS